MFGFMKKKKDFDILVEECSNHPEKAIIADFVSGEMPIEEFWTKYKEDNRIADFLQKIIDFLNDNKLTPKRRTIFEKNVNQNKPFEARSYAEDYISELRRENPTIYFPEGATCPTVKEDLDRLSYKTAHGALEIHETVADIYFQIDNELIRTEKYHEAYQFSLDILPAYLGGVEAEEYISEMIIPKYPVEIKKTERKKRIKEEIRNEFKRETKGYPRWIQDPEWPIGSNNKPMIYQGQKHYDDFAEYFFVGNGIEEKRIIRQCW